MRTVIVGRSARRQRGYPPGYPRSGARFRARVDNPGPQGGRRRRPTVPSSLPPLLHRPGRPRPPARRARRTARSSRATSSRSTAASIAEATVAGVTSASAGSPTTNDEPLPGTEATPDVAAHRARKVAADGQAEPGPGHALALVEPGEGPEDALQVGALDAGPVVPDDDDGRGTVDPPATTSTSPPRGANLQALAARFVTICSTRRRSARTVRRRGGRSVTTRISRPAAMGSSGARARSQASASEIGLDLEAQVPGLDPAQLQQVADERRHPLHDAAPSLDELAADLGIVDRSVGEQVQVAAQAGQRRAELVGDHRHEALALALAGLQVAALVLVGGPAAGRGQRRKKVAERRGREARRGRRAMLARAPSPGRAGPRSPGRRG